MNNSALLAACQLAFQEFLAKTDRKPEHIPDYERMLFQAAFTMGSNYELKKISDELRKAKGVV